MASSDTFERLENGQKERQLQGPIFSDNELKRRDMMTLINKILDYQCLREEGFARLTPRPIQHEMIFGHRFNSD